VPMVDGGEGNHPRLGACSQLAGYSLITWARKAETLALTSPTLCVLPLDGDRSLHVGMYLAVVGLLARSLEGVRIALPFPQAPRVERSAIVGRCGVRRGILVDPSDLRPPLDGDVGRLEAEVLDQDRPCWMFL
jgi:hypothetical protein